MSSLLAFYTGMGDTGVFIGLDGTGIYIGAIFLYILY